ncbi:alpha-crystallin-type small heat shock protein [Candidatus Termititenax persephonae]|uniref:Alpha-crystallin-type small heat shock protein n=1 Tax=Candidatus Termititenax persephonae TaxID=2218525 RepID=A0A388TG38_9BACT|nr:alpha-crystallin-type small heat shock protein [Candidatus Termititenax persephonae]
MLPTLFRRGDFGDLLDRIFDSPLESERGRGFYPRVDIHEDKDNVYVEADLAGLEQKDIKVEVDEDNVLKLSGEREYKQEDENKNYYRVERQYGHFERSFALGQNVEAGGAKAEFKNGELRLTIPKKADKKPRTIEIK